jgi:hypothetical protein
MIDSGALSREPDATGMPLLELVDSTLLSFLFM